MLDLQRREVAMKTAIESKALINNIYNKIVHCREIYPGLWTNKGTGYKLIYNKYRICR